MKFQKALKEAIVRNRESIKRLDEASTSEYINNWPILVAELVQTATMSSSASKAMVSQFLSQDITVEGENKKWTGEMSDIIDQVRIRRYTSNVYDINSSDSPITKKDGTVIPPKSIVVGGKPVGYVSKHPAVVLLVNKIGAILKAQKGVAGDLEATKQARAESEADRIKRIQQQAERNAVQRKADLGIG